ncbi:MAG TPA: GNAT family N-acetyltransferase [Pirellulales bacterium]|jgi:hypothetical protein|nr:GNAT family N-acetyltransferase [Pirellulales bacterium]
MATILEACEFTAAMTADVQGFICGSEEWELDMANWITGQRVITAIADSKNEAQVWLYYSGDFLVGFGSLAKTRWPWPMPDGKHQNLAIIPALAIQSTFKGKPEGVTEKSEKFSNLLMSDLIAKARLRGVPGLVLFAHPKNTPAIRLYSGFGFIAFELGKNGFLRMGMPL